MLQAGQLYGVRSRLHRPGGKNSAAPRQPFWPKSVTYVSGPDRGIMERAMGIETTSTLHSTTYESRARTEKEGLGSPWNPYCRLNAAFFPMMLRTTLRFASPSVLLACRCSWSFECAHASIELAELSRPLRAHATSTNRCAERYAIQHGRCQLLRRREPNDSHGSCSTNTAFPFPD